MTLSLPTELEQRGFTVLTAPPPYSSLSEPPPSQPSRSKIPRSQLSSSQPLPSQPLPTQVPPTQPLSVAARGERYRQELFARCADGEHDPITKFGPCGIITAVLCFPVGLICLRTDSERRCSRCGILLQNDPLIIPMLN